MAQVMASAHNECSFLNCEGYPITYGEGKCWRHIALEDQPRIVAAICQQARSQAQRKGWFKLVDFSGQDLSGCIFHECTFDGANFNKAKMQQGMFRKCSMPQCRFREANIGGARLTDCNLHGADFSSAILVGTTLNNSDLSRAIFSNADWSKGDATYTVLNNAVLINATLLETNFRKTQMNSVRLDTSNAANAKFSSAMMVGASFAGASLENSKLVNADLRDATLYGAKCMGADFRGAHVRGCKLQSADLSNATFSEDALRSTHLEDTVVTGIDLDYVGVPGVQVYGHGGILVARWHEPSVTQTVDLWAKWIGVPRLFRALRLQSETLAGKPDPTAPSLAIALAALVVAHLVGYGGYGGGVLIASYVVAHVVLRSSRISIGNLGAREAVDLYRRISSLDDPSAELSVAPASTASPGWSG